MPTLLTKSPMELNLSQLLELLVEEIQVPDSKYEEIKQKYEAVANWLSSDGTTLAQCRPTIHPQGSFSIGTAIKPLHEGGEYDVDLVCYLQNVESTDFPAKVVKQLVGDRLKEHLLYKKLLENEGKRCWTLQYAESTRFHLDILPTISCFPETTNTSMLMTDKNKETGEYQWLRCNPLGYRNWFKDCMSTFLQKRIQLGVEALPTYNEKTPLQKVVQLLKRHRDQTFEGDANNKPASIIITTLAGLAYSGTTDLWETLNEVVPKFRDFIAGEEGSYVLTNPAELGENFLDRWNKDSEKAEAFFDWLAKVESLIKCLPLCTTTEGMKERLNSDFDQKSVAKVLKTWRPLESTHIIQPNFLSYLLNGLLAWMQKPTWEMIDNSGVTVSISAEYMRPGGIFRKLLENGKPLPKRSKLIFTAKSTSDKYYTIYWQVTNTYEPEGRGDIFLGEKIRRESTFYSGSHSIECFLVDNQNQCVARSGKFIVNIA
jgi:hypothetical protein